MSNLYNLEPQPTAKVILRTTTGDLSLELFAKQTPLASRNFLQHCLDGYYDNTIFHRLLPGFIVQGGDPTGTGSGGVSAINNGEPFADEFHSRLKFNRRGLLGSANESKDSNGSQFFLTLGVTPELQGKHTMFGRIEGDTIYNLMKIGDAELMEGEGSDRPMYPTRILSTEILVNPFEDMVAIVQIAPRVVESETKKDSRKRKKLAGKNVLSFGGDDTDDIEKAPLIKRTKVNPKLISEPVDLPLVTNKPKQKPNHNFIETTTTNKDIQVTAHKPIQIEPPRTNPKPAPAPDASAGGDEEDEHDDDDSDEHDQSFEVVQREKRAQELENTKQEIAALKASMKRNVDIESRKAAKPKGAIESMTPSNSTRGRRRGKAENEQGALDLFKAFKARLEELPAENSVEDNRKTENTRHETEEGEEEALCDLHFISNCQSCKSWEDDDIITDMNRDGEEDDGAWMAHRLTFAKDKLGKDLEWKRKMEEIEVIDPREKAKAIKEAHKKTHNGRMKR